MDRSRDMECRVSAIWKLFNGWHAVYLRVSLGASR